MLVVQKHNGQNMPRMMCVACKKYIIHPKDAIVWFKPLDDGNFSVVDIVHKGKCNRKTHSGINEYSMDLGVFLSDLLHNTGLLIEDIKLLEELDRW